MEVEFSILGYTPYIEYGGEESRPRVSGFPPMYRRTHAQGPGGAPQRVRGRAQAREPRARGQCAGGAGRDHRASWWECRSRGAWRPVQE